MENTIGLEPASQAKTKTPGEKLEGVAFTFCKAATICLIAGRFALPVAATLAAALFLAAFLKGQRESRCILRVPLLIAGFWVFIVGIWVVGYVYPDSFGRFVPFWWR